MTTLRVSFPQHCTLHAVKYSECPGEASIHQPRKQFRCVQCPRTLCRNSCMTEERSVPRDTINCQCNPSTSKAP